jgi:hypothetical protein
MLKDVLCEGASWHLTTCAQRESLDMICNKIGRIVNGDPRLIDSWLDIAGYAQLVVDELTKEE